MSVHSENGSEKRVVIIGGGPSGLTAAYELTVYSGVTPIVLEKLDKVGGIARTENFNDFYFDMGGHRFFTKSRAVNRFWHQILGDDFLRRPRLSRIYYDETFFQYPIKPFNALAGLGLWRSFLVLTSYIKWQVFPYEEEKTFEQWVTNRFGKQLFETFFEAYTEKVWGIPCSELSAEWAAQRIKDLSLKTTILSMFVKPKTTVKTLIEEFDYPRRGPGMMWNAVADRIQERNGEVRLNSNVIQINRDDTRLVSVVVETETGEETIAGDDFISSMPITQFVKRLDPPAPADIVKAADMLSYRDFLTVCLIINKKHLFPDNWIYIHEPNVKVGRIQNFKNWSADMVPDQDKTSLGLEYFCNMGDELWNMPDEDLIELGKREVARIGLANYDDIENGAVFRVEHSYPVYDSEYAGHLARIRAYVEGLENFQTIGRNGLHRYNNQDHAMLTGMFAVRNLMLGEQNDLWSVNEDQEYHEEIREEVEFIPRDVTELVQGAIGAVFSRLDTVSFGIASGLTLGVMLFVSTLLLVIKGGDVVGPNFQLLNQFFPGYTVTLPGSFIILAYGMLFGFAVGWAVAFLRNTTLALYVAAVERRMQIETLRKLLDF